MFDTEPFDEEVPHCKCGKSGSSEPHTCPYTDEFIEGAEQRLCNCCKACSKECFNAI